MCVCVAGLDVPAESSQGRSCAACARERAEEKQRRDAAFGWSMKPSSCVKNPGPNMWLFAGFSGGERESRSARCQVLGAVRGQS